MLNTGAGHGGVPRPGDGHQGAEGVARVRHLLGLLHHQDGVRQGGAAQRARQRREDVGFHGGFFQHGESASGPRYGGQSEVGAFLITIHFYRFL